MRLANTQLRLDISPALGARWTRLRARVRGEWADLLWAPDSLKNAELNSLFGGAFMMAPWCNRIPGAKFTFKREAFPLRPNFPDGSAIHGDVFERPWKVVSSGPASVVLALDSAAHPDFNFPFPLRFGHRVRLLGPRLEASLAVMNMGDEPAPVGLGFHPFFKRRLSPHGRAAFITIPGTRYFPSVNAIPTGSARDVTREVDARTGVSLDEKFFDTGYTGFAERPVSLIYPDEKFEVWVTPGTDARHLYVWSPENFEGKPAEFVCVEPMTMSVNGFARMRAFDHGVRILMPRERFSMSWTVEVGERYAGR